MKLPIPLETVTMTAKQYETLCNNIDYIEVFTKNLNQLFQDFGKKGIRVEAEKDFLEKGWDDILISRSDMSGEQTIKIIPKR